MRSTLAGPVPGYIGADLTDRYSLQCRDIDVCGLTPHSNGGFSTVFWRWRWDRAPTPLDVTSVAGELRSARAAMCDGPQALASPGSTIRVCERQSAAVGKTPDTRPSKGQPFGGFICSSIDLFNALHGEGIPISPPGLLGGVSEVYPGHIWMILSGGRPLPQKSTEAGRQVRKCILEVFGISGLPALPTHDQNDASVAALIAAAADHRVAGINVISLGAPLSVDNNGILREGPMVIPEVTTELANRIDHALSSMRSPEPLSPAVNRRVAVPATHHLAAEALLEYFVSKAIAADPEVCTYAGAYRLLFNASSTRFSQAYARQVIDLACSIEPRELPGLGLVRLDTFIVSKQDRLPSKGYWLIAAHDCEEWVRVLGNSKVLD